MFISITIHWYGPSRKGSSGTDIQTSKGIIVATAYFPDDSEDVQQFIEYAKEDIRTLFSTVMGMANRRGGF